MDNTRAHPASQDRATRPADQAPAGLGDTASVPCAEWPQEFGDELMRCFRKEIPEGFRRWWARWGGTVRFWRVKSLARTAYEDGFEVGARAALIALREVAVFAAAGEAGTAITPAPESDA